MLLQTAKDNAASLNANLPAPYVGNFIYTAIAVMEPLSAPFYTGAVLLVPVSRLSQVQYQNSPVKAVDVFKGMRAKAAYDEWMNENIVNPYPNTAASVAAYEAFFDAQIAQITV